MANPKSLEDIIKYPEINNGMVVLPTVKRETNKKVTQPRIEILNGRTYYRDSNGMIMDLDDKGNPVKAKYIGGTKSQTRDKFWEQAPIMRHAVDSIAGRYGLNPNLLRNRLSHEGFVDKNIKYNNYHVLNKDNENPRNSSNYEFLQNPNYRMDGFDSFGMDDVGTMLKEGKVNLINETWYDETGTNEHMRDTNSASGRNNLDNIGLQAATLRYFRDTAKQNYPNATDAELDAYANMYYNRGESGANKYIKRNGTKGYNIRKSLTNAKTK